MTKENIPILHYIIFAEVNVWLINENIKYWKYNL